MSTKSSDPLDRLIGDRDRLRAKAVETALDEHPSVAEAAVLRRDDVEGRRRLVAYVVPSGAFSPEGLQAHLQQTRFDLPLPDAYVPVSAMPLCETGEIDAARLSGLAVVDEPLAERWAQAVKQVGDVDQVEVTAKEFRRRAGRVHVSDLVPEARAARAPAGPSPSTEPGSKEAAGETLPCSVPSISDGGPAQMPADAPATLGAALVRAAERHPGSGIVYVEPDGSTTEQSYPELLDEAARVLGGLRSLGLAPGDKVIFQFDRNRDFLAAFWGCVLGGMVPVPISVAPVYEPENAVVQKLANAWRMLDGPVILAGNSLAPAIGPVLDDLGLKGARVRTLKQLRSAHRARDWHAAEPDDLTLLLLTSGSTGVPKAVMHSHRTLLSRSASVIRFNGFTSADVSLNWMPLDHVGGIVMYHLRDVVAGGRQIHVPTERILKEPLEWLDLIDRHRVSITWAPNFAFGLVNERSAEVARRRWDLSSLRFILNAGEAIVAKTARTFLEILIPHGLPATSMKPAWGMSETSSAVTYSERFTLEATSDNDRFVEVGRPIPGIALRIVDENNRMVSEGVTGHLQIRGATVTSGYYRNPEVNREAFTGDGWFVTGDLGVLRDGALTITGRAKDEIIINGVNYIGSEIEAAVEAVEGVETSFTAACAVRTAGEDTDGLAIFFSPRNSDEDALTELVESIRTRAGSDIGIVPSYLIPLDTSQIPKTAIGKIQRSRLKDQFQRGQFDEVWKRIDVLAGTGRTMPDWFFRKVWFCKEPEAGVGGGVWEGDRPIFPAGKSGQSPAAKSGQTAVALVFADRAGLADSVCERLRRAGQSFVVVERGDSFAQLEPGRYCIDPGDRDDYRRLIASTCRSGPPVGRVVHLWSYADSTEPVDGIASLRRAQDRGLFSLLLLVQALAAVQGEQRPVRLDVFGTRTQVTSPDDAGTCEHSTVIGLLKTIPLEMPWLRCRHVDLEFDAADANARRVLRELQIVNSEEEVAYRGGRRLVWGLSRADLRKSEPCPAPITQGGVYLLTGGLGGVGSRLARLLIDRFRAKLIIIGTTRLPERSQWPKRLDEGGKIADRIRAYLDIEASGGDFIYQAVDVADLPGLRDAAARGEAAWQSPLAGVFHLAADVGLDEHWNAMERHRVAGESVEDFETMFRSKVYGTWALYEMLRDRPDAVFVAFGSAITLFGGASFGAYTAAQSFLSSYCLHKRHRSHPGSRCFVWSMWDEVGSAKDQPEFVKEVVGAVGYASLSTQQGMDSLLAGLFRDEPELVVGLDGGNPNVQRYLYHDSYACQEIAAYYTTHDGSPADATKLGRLEVPDRFGTPTRCRFRHLAEMPLTGDGRIDRQSLLSADDGRGKRTSPRNKSERRVAAIWREVLGVRDLGVHDAFFQLGGNSLHATQVLSRISAAFRVQVSLREFFANSTIARLAALVDRQTGDRAGPHRHETIRRTDAESLLDALDDMSDEQVAELLSKIERNEDTR